MSLSKAASSSPWRKHLSWGLLLSSSIIFKMSEETHVKIYRIYIKVKSEPSGRF
jgi:hypothetical protein